MAIIQTFTGKGSSLTYAEIDANFDNINDELITASSDIGVVESILSNATPLATAGTLLVRDAEGDASVRELGVTTIRFLDGTSLSSKAETGVESGTRMSFNQSTAPTGWTKDTSTALNDSIMRIVTDSVTSGGATAFSTFNGQTSVGATTLTLAQIPSHPGHVTGVGTYNADMIGNGPTTENTNYVTSVSTGSYGGGQSHTHTMTTNIKYNDFIIASKD